MRFALATLMAITSLTPAVAHPWTKTYVVEWSEAAFYYGAKEGVIAPGTDCPKGTNPDIDWVKVMVDAGYTKEEATWLRNPANPTRSAIHSQNQMAFRGKDRANVYANPTSTPESGEFLPVSGAVAEGLNLDGDERTGFSGLAGEKGVDNNFYKALGCWKYLRGPQRQANGNQSQNGYMRDGRFTTVIVVSGQGPDPMNDPKVTVGFYDSPDAMVKDGNGNIARDYTFRIRPSAKYEVLFPAKTAGGEIVSTEAAKDAWFREPSYAREVELLKAQLRLKMQPDGSLKGYIGGYRPWRPVYQSWVDARGPVIEELMWVRLPDIYYALRRYADYSPAGPRGEKTHISYAMRVEALPAYVMTPDAKAQVAKAQSFKTLARGPDPEMARTKYNVVDGVVVPLGAKAISQTAEQLRPPAAGAAKPAVAAAQRNAAGGL
ncbi:hypothetical protein [Phenylobacterium sp.]|jgi:hypothetical protein|uniref:hypothetical protein n=1 Tax=Phenylobacterium sp. TaxID=1871053 RepID=UPI002F3E3647